MTDMVGTILSAHALKLLEHSLPNSVRYVLTKFPGCTLAGGAVVSMLDNTRPNDWDIFVNETSTIKNIMDTYFNVNVKVLRKFSDYRFVELDCYGVRFNLIHRPHACPREIFDTFDIQLCKHAIHFTLGKNPKMQYTRNLAAVNDRKLKEINICYLKNPVRTISRIAKYEAR